MKLRLDEFKPVDYETWLAQIKKDLKDKPIEILLSKPERDISIQAWHHPELSRYNGPENTYTRNINRLSNTWRTRKVYAAGENAKILNDLNNGVDALSLPANDQDSFDASSKAILFEHVTADIRIENREAATTLKFPQNAVLNFDVISLNLREGEWNQPLSDFFDFFQAHRGQHTIWVNAAQYGEGGSTTIQELAFAIAHLNEYVQYLHDSKIDLPTISRSIAIELSITDNYFVNIAKFRAFRALFALLFSGYDTAFEPSVPLIYAKTARRYMAVNDANNNLLRATTQAMSAILGGCDVLTVDSAGDSQLNERMARNISLILREESYFDRVIDPAAGSYYVEALTDQLIEKAWKLFLDVEDKGGFIQCLKSNFIQSEIGESCRYLIDQVASGHKTFLGVNKFQSKLETWKPVRKETTPEGTSFRKIPPLRLEPYYEPKTVMP